MGGAAVQPGESGELHRQPSSGEMETVLTELVRRLEGNYPFHSPVYAGQMLKPPHELAWLAHSLTMLINPNNHALDGGPPTSVMEKEGNSAIRPNVWVHRARAWPSDQFRNHCQSGSALGGAQCASGQGDCFFRSGSLHP